MTVNVTIPGHIFTVLWELPLEIQNEYHGLSALRYAVIRGQCIVTVNLTIPGHIFVLFYGHCHLKY